MPLQGLQPTHRRKANKRRVDSDDDRDEDGDSDPLNISPGKEHIVARRKRIAKVLQDPLPMDLGSLPQDVAEAGSQSPSKARGATTPTTRPEKQTGENKRAARSKKKRIVVESGEEEEEEEDGFPEDAPDSPYRPQHTADEDDEYIQEPSRSDAPVKQKGLVRRRLTRSGNIDPVAKGKRGKAKKETKEVTAKNEGDNSNVIQGLSQAQGNPVTASGRSRLADDTKAADSIPDLSSSEPSKVQAMETAEVATPPQLPKKKLPTIKKTKAPVTTSPAISKSASGPPPINASETTAIDSRVIAANVGSADFDLRKPSVYAELFKSAGGNIPRSGLNRREKDEERRRELNRMKEEARAKRAAEAKPAFDLQAQWDKISRFEERLRQEKSSVLFPNFLAAKFKDDWERQRRKDADRERTNKGYSRENRPKD